MDHFYLKQFIYLTAFFLLLVNYNACSQDTFDSEKNEQKEKQAVKVGAWYFGGWSFPPDNEGYTFHISPTLVNDYPEREPLWGWREDDPEIMEKQINYAADAGLSFWGFCWYENTLVDNPELMDHLNNALELFVKAPNRERLDFFLFSCHPVSPENWEIWGEKTISYLKMSNYLKVNGKPIIIFFNTDEVIEGLGGLQGTHDALDSYREKARMKGVGEILIGARTTPRPENPEFQKRYEFCGFDFLTTYHQSDFGREHAGGNDYSSLIDGDKYAWNAISSNTDLKYIPTLSAGYDMRPWASDHPTIPASDFWYTGVTPQRIANHLSNAIDWAQANESKVLGDLMIIYAWNENGEGAWLTPTKANGTARLDEIGHTIDEMNTEGNN